MMIILAVVVLAAAFLALNLADAGRPVMMAAPSLNAESLETFAAGLTGPAVFDKDNGFYGLWTLTEPDDADIAADAALLKYRGLQDPSLDITKHREAWLKDKANWATNKEHYPFKAHAETRKRLIAGNGDFDSYFASHPRDWIQSIRERRVALEELKTDFRVPLERYQKIIRSEKFSEFTEVSLEAPLPNLLAWLHTAKAYNAVQIALALDGNWTDAITGLLEHVKFGKRVIRSSRTLIVNLVGKAVAREALMALVCLMNQPEFPTELYGSVSAGLIPLKHEEYGSRVPLLLEGYLYSSSVEQGGLFYQKNRTRQYFFDYFSRLADLEISEPFQWRNHPSEMNVKTGFFWRLQNAGGKEAFQSTVSNNFGGNMYTVVFKSFNLRTTYEMARIAAEVHVLCRAGKTVEQALAESVLYRELPDPCSGEKYRWNPGKQVLYSLGTDKNDDGGVLRRESEDTDNPVPIIVYVHMGSEIK